MPPFTSFFPHLNFAHTGPLSFSHPTIFLPPLFQNDFSNTQDLTSSEALSMFPLDSHFPLYLHSCIYGLHQEDLHLHAIDKTRLSMTVTEEAERGASEENKGGLQCTSAF